MENITAVRFRLRPSETSAKWPFDKFYVTVTPHTAIYTQYGDALSFPFTRAVYDALRYIGPEAATYQEKNEKYPTTKWKRDQTFQALNELVSRALVVVPVNFYAKTQVIAPFTTKKSRNELQLRVSPTAEKAAYNYACEKLAKNIEALASIFPAVSASIHTECGTQSMCATCPNAFAQLQGACTPGMPQCHTSLLLSKHLKARGGRHVPTKI